jgi:hypothetical protein
MIPLCIRKRIAARRLARKLVASLCTNADWRPIVVEKHASTGYMLGDHNFVAIICHSKIRLFDVLYVSHKGNELWFPLLWRLRIRCAVRWRSLVEAGGAFNG